MKAEILLALKNAAHGSLGLYPKGTVRTVCGFKVKKKRTKWQDGWNEAVIAHTKRTIDIMDWYKSLDDIKDMVGDLLVKSKLELYFDEGKNKVTMAINSSDIFAWGYSDSEEMTEEDIKSYYLTSHEKWCDVKWCCKKYNEKPQYPMIWDMHRDGEWDKEMEALPDNKYNEQVGWPQSPTKPFEEL